MFGKKLRGSELIDSAIGQFENIIADIETGCGHNAAKVDANAQSIVALQKECETLADGIRRGQSVAAKLRELIA